MNALRRGFTLIEVLVAVAILGVGLTAILAAQAGTFTSLSHARNISQSTGLLRCKVSEVEDDLRTNGFAQNDVVEATGPCCDGATQFPMTCTWRVERPTFPDPKIGVGGDIDASVDLGNSTGSGAGGPSALANAMHGGMELPQSGNLGDMASAISQGGGSITDTITNMFMSIAYPEMQQVFENGTRKVTVIADTGTEGAEIDFRSSETVECDRQRHAPPASPAEIPTRPTPMRTRRRRVTGVGTSTGSRREFGRPPSASFGARRAYSCRYEPPLVASR